MSSTRSKTQKKILDASLKLLVSSRGKNVRMHDIAKAAGVSRQAVYLNFESRTDLMVATVQYGDEINGAAEQVQPWRDAAGAEKLDAWIKFWGNYLPQIFGVAKVLLIAKESDDAAAAAWNDRMSDVRNSCRQTIAALATCGQLAQPWKVETATDMLWTMLSIPNFEQLTVAASWSTTQYIKHMQTAARQMFIASAFSDR